MVEIVIGTRYLVEDTHVPGKARPAGVILLANGAASLFTGILFLLLTFYRKRPASPLQL